MVSDAHIFFSFLESLFGVVAIRLTFPPDILKLPTFPVDSESCFLLLFSNHLLVFFSWTLTLVNALMCLDADSMDSVDDGFMKCSVSDLTTHIDEAIVSDVPPETYRLPISQLFANNYDNLIGEKIKPLTDSALKDRMYAVMFPAAVFL